MGRIGGFSASRIGKRLVFWRSDLSGQTYLSGFDSISRKMTTARRLTLDQSVHSVPFDWTPDSKAVVLLSVRNGMWGVYKQGLDKTTADILIETRNAQIAPARLSGDGSEILYTENEKPADPNAPVRLMAVPVTGGTPRMILSEPGIYNFNCAKEPSRICVLSSWVPKANIFYLLDLNRGKGRLLTKLPDYANWGLSPDGSTLVMVINSKKGHLRFLSIDSGNSKDVTVKDWPILNNADWSADSKVVLSNSVTPNGVPVILGIERDGNAKVLLEGDRGNPYFWVVPSPDGKLGALGVLTGESNVWMVENY